MQYKDLLQLMIDATVEEGDEDGQNQNTINKKRLSDDEITSHSITFMLAGYETTANALSYTSYLLALNPHIQEKLQEEIDSYFEENPVNKDIPILCLFTLLLYMNTTRTGDFPLPSSPGLGLSGYGSPGVT